MNILLFFELFPVGKHIMRILPATGSRSIKKVPFLFLLKTSYL